MVDATLLNVATLLSVSVLAFSVLLAVVGALSWRRLRSQRLAFVTAAFVVLAAKGALSSYRAIVELAPDLAVSGLDFAVLGLLYLSIAKR
ncbi:MAG TPA: hypothetical protein VM681_06340 [Candidatus Thermoplasmatota archaeon]|nr:hypothetical protein [Candidatus Thermoplasmatota archaeon]